MTEEQMRQLPVSELQDKLWWLEYAYAGLNDVARQTRIPLSSEERKLQSQRHERIMLAYKILRGE